jgi:hypothetical protein
MLAFTLLKNIGNSIYQSFAKNIEMPNCIQRGDIIAINNRSSKPCFYRIDKCLADQLFVTEISGSAKVDFCLALKLSPKSLVVTFKQIVDQQQQTVIEPMVFSYHSYAHWRSSPQHAITANGVKYHHHGETIYIVSMLQHRTVAVVDNVVRQQIPKASISFFENVFLGMSNAGLTTATEHVMPPSCDNEPINLIAGAPQHRSELTQSHGVPPHSMVQNIHLTKCNQSKPKIPLITHHIAGANCNDYQLVTQVITPNNNGITGYEVYILKSRLMACLVKNK